MRTRNLVAAVALAGAGAAIGWIAASGNAAAAAGTLTAQDYAEIEQLYWRYNHGGDFRDSELWLSAFTDDAIFRVAGRPTLSGMEELTAMRAERDAGQGDRGPAPLDQRVAHRAGGRRSRGPCLLAGG